MDDVIDMLLECRSIGKRHLSHSGTEVTALDGISFSLQKGQLLSIVGPSGSGKSTLLNIIAGVYEPSHGNVQLLDNGRPPKIGYVLQNNALFPWLTVRKNLTYSLDIHGIARKESDSIAADLCARLGLSPEIFLDKFPKELSGGEQRRIAIGMAIATTPDLLLLDEPGSQLDYEAKWGIQLLIQEIAFRERLAVICVTHDIEEAVFLGDRIMVLRAGRIADVIDIELPRPRGNDVRASDQFTVYRRLLLGQHDD